MSSPCEHRQCRSCSPKFQIYYPHSCAGVCGSLFLWERNPRLHFFFNFKFFLNLLGLLFRHFWRDWAELFCWFCCAVLFVPLVTQGEFIPLPSSGWADGFLQAAPAIPAGKYLWGLSQGHPAHSLPTSTETFPIPVLLLRLCLTSVKIFPLLQNPRGAGQKSHHSFFLFLLKSFFSFLLTCAFISSCPTSPVSLCCHVCPSDNWDTGKASPATPTPYPANLFFFKYTWK